MKKKKKFNIAVIIAFSAVCLIFADAMSVPEAVAGKDKKGNWQSEEKLLETTADSLLHLEKAIKKDGFSSAMTALNVWRSTAREAGAFDPVKYNDFKKRIYQKFIDHILKWFDACVDEGWLDDAGFWSRAYYVRSSEIGTFDSARYDEMKNRIQKKKKQIQRKKAEKNAANK